MSTDIISQAVSDPMGGFSSLGARGEQRYTVIGYAEISVDDIEHNSYNPRPNYMLADDDPYLRDLGDSIKVDGQHQAATVYEIVNHYDNPDQPGKYRLLQGESRWRAARLAGVPTLRCYIVAAPRNLAEELEWLGNEESFKRDWGMYFKMRYCARLAGELGVPIASTIIATKTGVSLSDLRTAERIVLLVPEVQAMVAEYERLMYDQRLLGIRPRQSRLVGSGVRIQEFTPEKAALVFDVFKALRDKMPQVVKDFDDAELQITLAQKASRNPKKDLEKLVGQIRQVGDKPPPGLMSQIAELLYNKRRDIKSTLRATNSEESDSVGKFVKQVGHITKITQRMLANSTQLGVDQEQLVNAQMQCLRLQRDLARLEGILNDRVEDLRKGIL